MKSSPWYNGIFRNSRLGIFSRFSNLALDLRVFRDVFGIVKIPLPEIKAMESPEEIKNPEMTKNLKKNKFQFLGL